MEGEANLLPGFSWRVLHGRVGHKGGFAQHTHPGSRTFRHMLQTPDYFRFLKVNSPEGKAGFSSTHRNLILTSMTTTINQRSLSGTKGSYQQSPWLLLELICFQDGQLCASDSESVLRSENNTAHTTKVPSTSLGRSHSKNSFQILSS